MSDPGHPASPSPRLAGTLSWLRLAVPLAVVALLGGLAGWLGATVVVPQAPPAAVLVADEAWHAPPATPSIEVVALAPPEASAAAPAAPETPPADDAVAAIPPEPSREADDLGLLVARALDLPLETIGGADPGSRDPGRFDHATPEREPEAVEVAPTAPVPDEAVPLAAAIPGPATDPRPPADPDAAPMLAIVIDDMGLNVRRTERVAALPGPLTLAFIPYGENLPPQVEVAAAAGHEIFLHLPMQPIAETEDPGPRALVAGLDDETFATELAWNLDRFDGYVGVNNHMGSLLTQDPVAMGRLMAELRRRGLIFVDSMTSAASVAYGAARRESVPVARRDVFLDNVQDLQAILDQLDKAEAIARRQGFAIAIGHPYDATIEALALWLPDAARRGLALVPASAIVERKMLYLVETWDN